ncbi:GNAT family N-acetyltransferase [Sporosarcina sp. CAU 1771]
MGILSEGYLKEGVPYSIRKLQLVDIDAILEIQKEVIGTLANKEFLEPLSKEEFTHMFSGAGLVVGVFADDRLIAFRATLAPDNDEEHLGYDIGLDASEHSSIVYQEITNVLPSYRGNRLQQKMATVLMDQLREEYTYVCSTVAPFNIASLKDKFAQQMEVAALKPKYGGMLRYVFVRNLHVAPKEYKREQSIPMQDTQAQQKLLSEGWRGVGIAESESGWLVHYRK